MKQPECAANTKPTMGRGMAAYMSRAQSRGVPVERVVEAASNDDLRSIIELPTLEQKPRIEQRNMARRLNLLRKRLLVARREKWAEEQGL